MIVNPSRLLRSALLTLLLGIVCCSCDQMMPVARKALPVRQDLPKIRTARGITGRSALVLATGLCVVLHFPPTDLEGEDFEEFEAPTSEEVESSTAEMRLLPYSHATTFNCVTFALADELQLGYQDWVEPFARESTFYTDPAQIALENYFDLTIEQPLKEIDWQAADFRSQLQHGDVVCYRQTTGEHRPIVHMGRLKLVAGKHSIISKFGVGPIAETTLEYCADAFKADTVSIYRAKRKRSR